MLYPRSAEEALSEELFKNPSSEYRGAPFWAWNCALEGTSCSGSSTCSGRWAWA